MTFGVSQGAQLDITLIINRGGVREFMGREGNIGRQSIGGIIKLAHNFIIHGTSARKKKQLIINLYTNK